MSIFQKLRKKNPSVVFQPISQQQYTAKRNGNGPVIFFFLCQHCAAQKQHARPSEWINRRRYICLLVHISIRSSTYPSINSPVCCSEQRFHLRNDWKNKKKMMERKRGRGVWSRAEPYPFDTKAHSDPWNTIEPAPLAPLGQAANNTHNAACLWLPESPVAALVQLVGASCQRRDARRQPIMPAYRCQILAHTLFLFRFNSPYGQCGMFCAQIWQRCQLFCCAAKCPSGLWCVHCTQDRQTLFSSITLCDRPELFTVQLLVADMKRMQQ